VFLKHEEIKIDRKLKEPAHVLERRRRDNRTVGFWCFNPGLGFKKLLKLNPRSVILTSGTLTPLRSFQQELLTDFPVKIENKHVITPAQAKISVITHGVGGVELNFSHKFRDVEAA